MIAIERKKLEQVLEALEDIANETYDSWTNGAKAQRIAQGLISTIKKALAQPEPNKSRPLESDYTSQVAYTRALERYCDSLAWPEQEPMAKYSDIVSDGGFDPRNTAPPKRPWVGLTDEETDALRSKTPPSAGIDFDLRCRDFARAIGAKLKELNT